MIITIAGIKRSASTAQFNMVRLCCLHAGYKVHTWGNAYKIKDGVNIIKLHPYNHSLYKVSDFIFTTDRNDKDILKSLERMWGGGNPKRLNKMRKHLNKWRKKSIHMAYNDIVNQPLKCIEIIADMLGLNIDCEAVLEEFEAKEPPNKGYDEETFLFANHISDK